MEVDQVCLLSQECPTSGRLLAEQIGLVARPQQKAKSAEALKKANDDAVLIAAVARIFWNERKYGVFLSSLVLRDQFDTEAYVKNAANPYFHSLLASFDKLC